MSLSAYDGMELIYRALEKTNGASDGTALVEAMKGSPGGVHFIPGPLTRISGLSDLARAKANKEKRS